MFNRRKKKVNDLMTKEEEQLQVIKDIRRENYGKYKAIIEFVKFFCLIKDSIPSIRTDYYSNKTFCAIKNANEYELKMATRAVSRMYNNIMNCPRKSNPSSHRSGQVDERIIEFLIIPRFLISK